mmetsp:Transcript_59560/g.70970  ORF Transcript_59560/g.70970 Transcript_59560/m.70970 type:complete len:235 (+) Transcript_59560:97-801(+)
MSALPLFDANIYATEDYAPPTFDETFAIIVMHNAPRMGQSNNVTLLLAGSDDEKKSYITGLLALPIIILTIFLTWSLVLLILKLLGGKRVGWASGAPAEVIYDRFYPEFHYYDLQRAERKLKRTRIVFLLAGVGAVCSIVSFVSYGLGTLNYALKSATNGINEIRDVADPLKNDTDILVETLKSIDNFTTVLGPEFEDKLCPALNNSDSLPDEIKTKVAEFNDYGSSPERNIRH